MATGARKRLIVVGAGFAGLNLVKRLKNQPIDIILVDRHNYHVFQPLLYQVATAALSPADIAHPIRRIFRDQLNVTVALGEVDGFDLGERRVFGGDASAGYDYLAIAVGSTHSYFGHGDWQGYAPGLKTIDDATEIRRRVLLAFEEAELEQDEESRRAKLTFAVVGGGPTGVELAGALREIAAEDIQRDFRNIDTTTTRVILLQGGDRLLPQFPKDLGDRAQRDLEKMGVEVRLNSRVTKVDVGGVWIGDEQLAAQNVLWAAGVQAPKVLKSLGVPLDKSGRVNVRPDLSLPGHPEVFVMGDCAAIEDPDTHEPVPGLAAAAVQMGKFVGDVLKAEIAGNGSARVDSRPAFRYFDKGTMATIGKRRAVADIRGWHVKGLLAWLLWSLVHVALLIGFRSKLFVMAGWIYDYVFKSREARLITGNFKLRIQKVRGGHPVVRMIQQEEPGVNDNPVEPNPTGA